MTAEFATNPDGKFWDRVQTSWGNGTRIEFLLHEGPLPGEDPSDRLQVLVTDCDGLSRGWLMNIEDAVLIIRGLSRLVDNALRLGFPISSNYEERNARNQVEEKPETPGGI